MDRTFNFISDPSPCAFLPDRLTQMECKSARGITRLQLQECIQQGWRRQGALLFRTACDSCNACQSLRVILSAFEPNRSQRRVIKANQNTRLEIRKPSLSIDKVALNVLHHNHHAEQKDWPTTTPAHAISQIRMLGTEQHVEEWSYYIDNKLVAINFVDVLEEGLSGVYFFHHPEYRKYSLGTWCVLSMILRARELGMKYAYLGFYVEGCRSMEYKGRFGPAEILTPDRQWIKFDGPDTKSGDEAGDKSGEEK
jgi:arginyl-tRNA--protein-N-Asp/Glu arginylyltransferase